MGSGSRPQKRGSVAVRTARRLNSWKEIAAYLDASVRTVQRWEHAEALPVHRHEHSRVATAYAYTAEVDSWLRNRQKQIPGDPGGLSPSQPSPRPKRLIVLPFRLVRPDPEIEFLSFGLADAIAASLSGLASLVVRSSMVAANYADESDLKRIASDAIVDFILTGTLLRAGDEIRVTAHLVEAVGGTVVRSQTAHCRLHDIFKLQDRVLAPMMDSLALPLNAHERRLLARDVPINPSAYEYYLRANELAYDFDPVARDLYLRSVEEDPNYAPAWARLGRCCRIIAKFGEDPENFSKAEEALRRALELNPELGLAHTQLAYLEADSGRAEHALVRLLSLAKETANDTELFAGLVHVCRYCGLLEASLAAHERACRLDPHVRTSVCHTYFLLGDYPRAVAAGREVLGYIGPLALMLLGRDEEAVSLARRMECTSTRLPLVRCAFSCVRALAEGSRAEALVLVERMLALQTRGPEELYITARQFAYLSEVDRALLTLKRAVDEGFFCYPALVRDPWLHSLRARHEFDAILRLASERHASAVRAFVAGGGERILGAVAR